MTKINNLLLALLFIAGTSLCLTACGGDDEDETTPPGGNTTNTDSGGQNVNTASLIGYYSADAVRQYIDNTAKQMVQAGDNVERNWREEFNKNDAGMALRIVDATTIYYVPEGCSTSNPGSGRHVYDTKTYNVGRSSFTVYFYIYEERDASKYVVRGDKLITADDRTYIISGNQLLYNGTYAFTKVK